MSSEIIENEYIKLIAGSFSRAPYQLNAIFESDAELIGFDNDQILAITYDAIVEEIEKGLYTDHYQIGWMAVTISVSDLAAVGAQVLGLLLDLRIPSKFYPLDLKKLQKGINDACKYYGCYVLGGDTNRHDTLQIGTTALGFCKNKLMRKGMRPSDVLYVSGKMGLGSSFVYARFFENSIIDYLPKARNKEGRLLSEFASSCMDTSDGLFPAICQLMELNGIGFNLEVPLREILHKSCLQIIDDKQLPHWIFLAGPHGEYELLFTVPVDKIQEFENEVKQIDWKPIRIGHVNNQKKVLSNVDGLSLNVFEITNIYEMVPSMSPEQYLLELLKLDKEITL